MQIGDRIGAIDAKAGLSTRAIFAAIVLHVIAFAVLNIMRSPIVPWDEIEYVPITIIPKASETPSVIPKAVITKPAPAAPSAPPKAAPMPDVKPPAVAPVLETPPPVSAAPSELITPRAAIGVEISSAPTIPPDSAGGDYRGSRWALKPPLEARRLEGLGLGDVVDCLQSLSDDCTEMRKEVFAEYQMSETDKVWTERRADTGMPSEFYGLSERDIRLKVGSKIAGENGFMILPGIGIDGELWDRLNGVKKTCKMQRGIDSSGTYNVVRVCPDSLPAANDRKYYIPPKE